MKVLKQRGQRYGKFSDNAKSSQAIQNILKQNPQIENDEVLSEAVTYIAQKLSRLANGDATYIDTWRDIAGYALLVVDYLENEAKEATDAVVYTKTKKDSVWSLVDDRQSY